MEPTTSRTNSNDWKNCQAQLLKDAGLFYAVRKILKEGKSISKEKRLQKVKDCLNSGANITSVDKNDNENTVLHLAVYSSYPEIVKFLINNGANIDSKNKKQQSSLELANDSNIPEIIQIFQQHMHSSQFRCKRIKAHVENQNNTEELDLLDYTSQDTSGETLFTFVPGAAI